MASVTLATANGTRAQCSAPVVWVDWRRVAIDCPLCESVEEHNLRQHGGEARQGLRLPEIVMASCCISNVPLRIELPGAGFKYNGDKGRFEVTRFGRPEVMEDRLSTYETREEADDVEFDTQQELESASSVKLSHTTEFDHSIISSGLATLLSIRVANTIEILAPLASKNGNRLGEPLATIRSSTNVNDKTIAVLYRGAGIPPVIAVSGWKSGVNGPYLLDQEKWYLEVKKLQALVKHESGWGRWGQKYAKGQEASCHAEKLAMAYFVRNFPSLSDAPFGEERGLEAHEAWIASDREACLDCKEFKAKLERKYNVTINFVTMRNDSLEQKVLHRGNPRTPLKASRPRNIQIRTPPESGSKLQRSVRESSYGRKPSCDDSYVDDGDDEESDDTIDNDTDEDRGNEDDETVWDDNGSEETADTFDETDEPRDTPSPSLSRDVGARGIGSHRETKAGGSHPPTYSASIQSQTSTRKRPRVETSSSSDTEFGGRIPTTRPSSRPRQRRFEASLLRTTETEDDPFVDNTSRLFTDMNTSSDEIPLKQESLRQKGLCRRFILQRESGFLDSGEVDDNESHAGHEQGGEKQNSNTPTSTSSAKRALFSSPQSHPPISSLLNEQAAGLAPYSPPPSHPRNTKSNFTATTPRPFSPRTYHINETSLKTPESKYPLASESSKPTPAPPPFHPTPRSTKSNPTPTPPPSMSTPFCFLPPIRQPSRSPFVSRSYSIHQRPRPRGPSHSAPSSVIRSTGASSSAVRWGNGMSRTVSRKKNGATIDLTRD